MDEDSGEGCVMGLLLDWFIVLLLDCYIAGGIDYLIIPS